MKRQFHLKDHMRVMGSILSGVAVMLGLMAPGASAQREDLLYFRLSAPSSTVVNVESADGWLSWSNTAPGATTRVLKATTLLNGGDWKDYVRVVSTNIAVTQQVFDSAPPEGMVFIPGGLFLMGDSFSEGASSERPVHVVVLSNSFHMWKTEVTKSEWDEVYTWATNNGYAFEHAGGGKAANQPVHTISWHDAVKWCNAKSEREGLLPCYWTAGGVYRTGIASNNTVSCEWKYNGFRLPSEAEWEYAARGGAIGKRFAWSDTNTIQHAQANYDSNAAFSFDTSETRGYHPDYAVDAAPYTAPAGSFAPNDYGLCEMVGNVSEWCWDWYAPGAYTSSPPETGTVRVVRGGSWDDFAYYARVPTRASAAPEGAHETRGFRPVRTAVMGGEYLVIDLSGGPAASSYPVAYLSAVPEGGWTEEYKTSKLVMRRIPAGTFTMGSPTDEVGRLPEGEAQRDVTLTKDFYIGVFEVTQQQWELVMGNRPSYFTNATYYASRPVEQVSYYDIRENPANSSISPNWPQTNAVHADSFMGKLRAKTALGTLDLPTDAQWEYACRARTTTALNSGKNLTDTDSCTNLSEVGRYWYNGGSSYSQGGDPSGGTATVGSYLPNYWGLYDMHGNVWEWCLDWYDAEPTALEDPVGAASGSFRVTRGGGWFGSARYCRSANRGSHGPYYRFSDFGFRLSRTLP